MRVRCVISVAGSRNDAKGTGVILSQRVLGPDRQATRASVLCQVQSIARGGCIAASAAVGCTIDWLRVRDEELLSHRGGSEHCWASSNLLEPTWFVRTTSEAGAVGRGSQAEASDPGQTELRLRLSKGGRELGSISARTAGGVLSNYWLGERPGAAGVVVCTYQISDLTRGSAALGRHQPCVAAWLMKLS